LRDRALLTLGVYSGLRVSELLSLRVGQVWDGKEMRGRFYLDRRATKGKIRGASIVLHPKAAMALTRWFADRAEVRAGDYLFPSQRSASSPVGRRWVSRLLERAFTLAGVDGMRGTHIMRKTFAANVHRALQGDLFGLSRALRHSSPLTTLAYLSFKQDKIDRAILDT
jgi:integrase